MKLQNNVIGTYGLAGMSISNTLTFLNLVEGLSYMLCRVKLHT
jgi:hypothetical protein